jgi:hypothetical protein
MGEIYSCLLYRSHGEKSIQRRRYPTRMFAGTIGRRWIIIFSLVLLVGLFLFPPPQSIAGNVVGTELVFGHELGNAIVDNPIGHGGVERCATGHAFGRNLLETDPAHGVATRDLQ